jgi:hypothetical protein
LTSLSPKPHRITRAAQVLGALVAGVAVALLLAAPAGAATPCGKKVLNDWWDNGRVDKLYPLHCYEEAIDAVPEDIRQYSDAEQIISRALQAAVGGKLAPGGDDPSPGDPGDRSPGTPVPDPGDPGAGGSVAAPAVDSSGPSSIPIPLLILGGMSLALLAAGGVGYLSRRRREGHGGDDSDESGLVG